MEFQVFNNGEFCPFQNVSRFNADLNVALSRLEVASHILSWLTSMGRHGITLIILRSMLEVQLVL